VYSRHPVEIIKGSHKPDNVSLLGMLDEVIKKTGAMKNIQPRDLRMQQMSQISQMIREKK
jgi:hypothetical protein